jgi:hypothetical protein
MKIYLQSLLCTLCAFLILGLGGCDELLQSHDQTQGVRKSESAGSGLAAQDGIQRFLPIAPTSGGSVPTLVPWHGFFALDTRTGMLCRTVTKEFPKDSWANGLPICIDLSSARKDPNDPLGIRNPANPELEKELDRIFGPKKQ